MNEPRLPGGEEQGRAQGRRSRAFRWVGRAGLAVAVLLTLAFTWAYWQLRSSVPTTDGAMAIPGLERPVLVLRDASGVPTIQGQTHEDVARALGVVHAQDRFFQMDLARRRAAGELAELVGAVALPADREARRFRLRGRARAVVEQATAEERALVQAYSEGVNAGLATLGARPFEYLILRQPPRPWVAEDSVLVLASMFFSLQDEDAEAEGRGALLHDLFPAPLADFLDSSASQWESPLVGEPRPAPVPPGPDVFDWRRALPALSRTEPTPPPQPTADEAVLALFGSSPPESQPGSNNWALSGSRTRSGRAIVANDMHLAIGLPNIWYRASLSYYAANGAESVTGVTLPGLPAVVAGSNGRLAWGLTNTGGDWSDRVLVEPAEHDPTSYRLSGGTRPFETFHEEIVVRGGPAERLEVKETAWGPLMAPDAAGRLVATAWVPHQPGGMNLRLLALERARTIDEGMAIANGSGVPALNIVFGDTAGHIAWTIAGRIPKRVGFTGSRPESWADGTRGWAGWVEPADYPRVIDPPGGLIVTANNRLVDRQWLALLGDGEYDPGARARQIQRGLEALTQPAAADMLAVQLDDRAELMGRWRLLLLDTLTPAAVASHPDRRTFRRLVEEQWTGRASTESVAYRLVRQFRTAAAERAFAPFVARARAVDADFPTTPGRSLEGPVWALLTLEPLHLLDPRYADWDALRLDAVDRAIATLTEGGRRLEERTWGEANTLRVRHLFSASIPLFGRWLSLPAVALPGDVHMPRVQAPATGATERFAVSPGLEADGYFHMPGGQSGHPLSPHFTDGQTAWALGEPTPFLPGPPSSRLTLMPASPVRATP
ncbi:MAG: penicillin acylase family protein [Vicinamibacterales bacterium]